ncbi:MAG TPA: helicase-associated domain-containing protein [Dehalococcoidia bacterium]|nr:helicase-associated domain-containing protein [Dehalococcoidia bacterium]
MSDLDERLSKLSPRQREALAEAWGLPEPRSPQTADLAAALADPLIVKRGLAELSDRQLAALDCLDRAEYPPSARAVAADLGVSFEDLTADLRRLADLMLIRRATSPHPTDRPADPGDLPIEIRPALRSLVHQVLAHRVTGPVPVARRSAAPSGALADAPPLLAELLRRGGRAPTPDLIDRLGPDAVRPQYLTGLTEGWLDEAFSRGIWWLIARPGSSADPLVRDEGTALPWDLLVLVDQAEREPIERGATDWSIHEAQRERLTGLLRGSEALPDARLHWLVRLAVGLGLVEPAGRALAGTGRLAAWAGHDFPAQARRILDLWRDDLAWAEPKPPGRWSSVLDRPRLRAALIDRLRTLGAGEWLPVGDLARAVAAGGEARRGRGVEVPAIQIQALVRTMIELPIGWLGLLAFRSGDRWDEVALTEFGAEVLRAPEDAPVRDATAAAATQTGATARSAGDPIERSADPSLIVQGDLEIICLSSSPAALARVLRATDLVDPGSVSIHRLTRDSFWSAIDRGETAADLLSFLADCARHPVSESVASSLADWAARYRAISVRPVTLIAFDPPEALDDLPPDAPLRAAIERRIAPGLAILATGVDFAAFREQASAAGFRIRSSRP